MTNPFDLEEAEDNLADLKPRKLAERAHAVFAQEGWFYHDGPATVDRLEQIISHLIDVVVMAPEPNTAAATGRIVVEKEQDDGFTEWKVYLDLVDASDADEI